MRKRIYTVAFVILLAMTLIMFGKEKSGHDGDALPPMSDSALRQLELSYLRTVVDESLTPYSSIELAGIENIATSSEDGTPYLILKLFPGQQKKNNGIRSEVSIDYPYVVGDTITYSWQFRIPENFPSDAPQNRWWVLADWHDQPDLNKGETWGTYSGVGQSAPIIFGYGVMNGQDTVGFSYGHDPVKPIGFFPITKGSWHTITMTVRWSQGEDGAARVFVDGKKEPEFAVHGPNMHNMFQHYMKVGMYRHPDIATENTINLRNIKITKEK